MSRRWLVFLATVGLASTNFLTVAPAVTKAAISCVTTESQAWWLKTGIVVPTAVGAHVHVLSCVPPDGVIVDGPFDVPITITLHNQTAKVTSLRIQEANSSGNVARAQVPVSLGPCTDCSISLTVHLDFSQWTTGRNEIRISALSGTNSEGAKQYQSTGRQVCVRSCTPTYRSGLFEEARGWYTNHGYAIARLISPIGSLGSGATIKVKLAPGSGGLTTKFAGVYIDPDFHHGNAGTVVKTWNAAFTGFVTLPTLSVGIHKLVMLSSDGNSVGVLAIPFTVN